MSVGFSGFGRFLHWGPITALSIIKSITFTTLYMNSMWWPPNQSLGGFLNQLLFLLLSSTATFNYVMATLTGPGLLPKNWRPKNPEDSDYLQFCKECNGYKAPRSHHCRKCNRCVKKMDHHCPWINHCVGWANHAYFMYFLGFSILGSFQATIILGCAFNNGLNRYYHLRNNLLQFAKVQLTMTSILMTIFALGLAIGVVCALGMLLYFQIKSIIINQTGIEMWIVEKAQCRRRFNPEMDEFIYPYDLGWKQNFREVFNIELVMKGGGIHWPVIEECDQYTLTREQLAQKSLKRALTRTFKCTRPSTGSFLPLFSQGYRVCMSPPCTDESRIALQLDDVIKVTRYRKYWLFGERVVENMELKNPSLQRKGPIRGWFPRRCAIELIEPIESEHYLYEKDSDMDIPENVKKNSSTINGAKIRNHKKSTNSNSKIGNGYGNGKKSN